MRAKLPFTRDNLVETYTWAIGMNDEPQHKYFREAMTKLICFLTTIDDVYDNYATLDEAQLFTDAVERFQDTYAILVYAIICCKLGSDGFLLTAQMGH